MGQIIENTHVRTLNPTQPINVPVPAPFIVDWSPVFGYLCVSGNAYAGFVYIFSGKNLTNTEQINDTCINRLIMVYPENSDPLYGMILRNKKEYILIHPRSREIIKKIIISSKKQTKKQIETMNNCILNQKPFPFDIEDSYRNMIIIDSIFKSSQTGYWVSIQWENKNGS